jgi:hypothetical protein
MEMSKIYALFDSKANATDAFDKIYDLYESDDDIDVRVYENDMPGSEPGQMASPAAPIPVAPGQPGIPVTGFFRDNDLNDAEQRYFRDRMGPDSVFAVIDADDVHDPEITQIIRQHNGQMVQD